MKRNSTIVAGALALALLPTACGKRFDSKYCVGHLEQVSGTEVVGWACDKRIPDEVVEVEILDRQTAIGTARANLFRPDLRTAGLGHGRHQFRFPIPESLQDGRSHRIRARFPGASQDLRGSPMTFEPASLKGVLELASDTHIVGWAFNPLKPNSAVDVEIVENGWILATAKADGYREDLERAGFGNGRHKFLLATPATLRDGKPHRIRVRFADTKAELTNSPTNTVFTLGKPSLASDLSLSSGR